jgi:hypothetical protein
MFKYLESKQYIDEAYWVIEEIREEIRVFLESNKNENTTYQNLWDTTQAMLR